MKNSRPIWCRSSPLSIRFLCNEETFVTISSASPNADPSKVTRQQPLWDEHAAFIDKLVAEGFIMMGGPLIDGTEIPHGALLIVSAEDENEVRKQTEERSLVREKHSETRKHQALANLH